MASWGSFDFSEFKKLNNNIDKALKGRIIDSFLFQLMNDIANLGVKKVKARTPSDRSSGEMKRNWYASRAERRGQYIYVEIYNTKEYASFVENGFRAHFVPGKWSGNIFLYDPEADEGMFVGDKKSGWVEGQFMLRISINELEKMMPAITNKKSLELLKKIFDVGGKK